MNWLVIMLAASVEAAVIRTTTKGTECRAATRRKNGPLGNLPLSSRFQR
jgi:hypothetical protein